MHLQTMNSSSSIGKRALESHRKLAGKIEVKSKVTLKSAEDLSIFYTPGVGAVSSYLASHKNEMRDFTIKKNTVAVISDGSAVLGLGNIGPEGTLPVMEGKAMLFKELADVNAFPIVLSTQEIEGIVETVKNIALVFGGINLEDIAAPNCFEIERRLIQDLDIPVVHDDQHGTAIVVLAALINSFKVIQKNLIDSKVVIIGAGAAGSGVARILIEYGVVNILVVDSQGIISKKRQDLDFNKKALANSTNLDHISGNASKAVSGADVIIGLSTGGRGKITSQMIKTMNSKPVIFAMANPDPEILPNDARAAGAFIVATGRSDFPNQINNVLVFPGLFRGALDNRVRRITTKMKIKAAENLASCVENPSFNSILPSVFDKSVVKRVSSAIKS